MLPSVLSSCFTSDPVPLPPRSSVSRKNRSGELQQIATTSFAKEKPVSREKEPSSNKKTRAPGVSVLVSVVRNAFATHISSVRNDFEMPFLEPPSTPQPPKFRNAPYGAGFVCLAIEKNSVSLEWHQVPCLSRYNGRCMDNR